MARDSRMAAEGTPVTDDLRLGLSGGYWTTPGDATPTVLAAERLGYESVWTAESWGSDALTPLAWYGARTSRIKLGTSVIQISARTPAATAMAAVTLDHLSGGRLMLGLGVSGPQVVEGWYGVPFAQPLARTRVYGDALAGAPPGFDIAAMVNVILTDDLSAALRAAKLTLGFYIGGMGARKRNFHLDVASRMGYEEAGRRVQELFLDGRRDEAIDAVPDALADAMCLLGPIGRIRERLELWRKSPVTTLLVVGPKSEPDLRAIGDAVLG